MKITALIPVKGFRNAKQRLSALLGSAEREAFAEAMFRDVLRQVLRASGITETVVVTGDDKVAAIAGSLGARVMLPGDLPLLRSGDIEVVIGQVPDGQIAPFALLVPSHDKLGTNALLLAPPDIIKLRFGYDSFSYHTSQVSAQGLPIRCFENEHIALDIDEPQDLEKCLADLSDDGEALKTLRRFIAARRSEPSRRVAQA
jgi:2-phospho-L-lactate guanylyltransferase